MFLGRFLALALVLVSTATATAFELDGFKMGMGEAEALSLARAKGIVFQVYQPGVYIKTGSCSAGGVCTLSFCNGKLYTAGMSFETDFHVFIGLVRERQARWGEPVWTTEQNHIAGPAKRLSKLMAKWDDPVQRYQPDVSVLYAYEGGPLTVSVAYSAYKYMCGR